MIISELSEKEMFDGPGEGYRFVSVLSEGRNTLCILAFRKGGDGAADPAGPQRDPWSRAPRKSGAIAAAIAPPRVTLSRQYVIRI